MKIDFEILRLDIFQSYLNGKVRAQKKEYTINVQNERRGKLVKLPILISTKKERLLVRFSGPGDIFIEDYLPYMGNSEWLEIDSDEITFFIADNQDKFDTIEITDGLESPL